MAVVNTHVDNFAGFLKDLNTSAKCVLPAQAKKYERVSVLLIRWEDDDLGTQSEITDLEAVFRDKYKYDTEVYLIPSHDAANQLEYKLVDWKKLNNDPNHLIILYYGGHGRLENRPNQASRSIWCANLTQSSSTLVWTDLQEILHRCTADVLFILDCCYAATASRGGGSKEGLWACNSELTTTDVNDNSFTRNLIQELKALCGTRYNVVILHQKLMSRYKKPGPHQLLTEPWYSYLGTGVVPSIELAPQSRTTISSCIEIPATETLVLLAVRLKSSEAVPDIVSWQTWLHESHPEDVDTILALGKLQTQDLLRLEGCYTTHSQLVLLSMPICLWDRLPQSLAYRFIAFVTSRNLLPLSRGETSSCIETGPSVNMGLRFSDETKSYSKTNPFIVYPIHPKPLVQEKPLPPAPPSISSRKSLPPVISTPLVQQKPLPPLPQFISSRTLLLLLHQNLLFHQRLSLHHRFTDHQVSLVHLRMAGKAKARKVKLHPGKEKDLISAMNATKRHKREVHEGVRPYECPICHLTFAREFDYRVHMHTGHGMGPSQSAYPPHYQSPGGGGSPLAPSHSAADYYNPAHQQ